MRRMAQIPSPMRQAGETVQRMRHADLVAEPSRDLETASIQRLRIGRSSAIAQHGAMPPQYVRMHGRHITVAEHGECVAMSLGCRIRRVTEPGGSRILGDAARFRGTAQPVAVMLRLLTHSRHRITSFGTRRTVIVVLSVSPESSRPLDHMYPEKCQSSAVDVCANRLTCKSSSSVTDVMLLESG